MSARACLANGAWAAASLRAWKRFTESLRDPASAQRQLLTSYLRDNAGTVAGRAYGFTKLLGARDPVRAYQESVPTIAYDDLEPFIGRIVDGEPGVLTRSPVRRLSPSSGSTSAAKLLPYTGELQQEFSRAVDAWIADLFLRHPRLLGGRAYWSITPAIPVEAIAAARLGAPPAAARVPIGFEDDSAYLGGMRQRLVQWVLAVPTDVRLISDAETFRYVTALELARARDLRLISVWHPSFLSGLLETLTHSLDRITHDVARGTITPAGPIPANVHRALSQARHPDPGRADELRGLRDVQPKHVWPELVLVSCWGDAAARPYARRLSQALSGVDVQPKGLIATEAIVSIPFRGGHPVAVRSHFFEFIDADGRARLAHELVQGDEYAVVVTTGGGLYRYRLGDRVRSGGLVERTPSLELVGRADRVSDRFGEKLSDGFVTGVLAELFERGPAPRFAMLAPESIERGVAYTLFVEPERDLQEGLAASLERALRRNPHYAWCVDLGQLLPARVVRVGPDADRAYVGRCVARGQRLGDVKPAALHPDFGWTSLLGADL
jgi:GH3 auxin-responsive promoter